MNDAPELVYSGGGGPPRADLFRSILEGSGIECYVATSGMSGMYPTNVGAMGEFQIYVRPQDAERARDLLEHAEEDALDMEIDEDFEEFDEAAWDEEPEEH
ncbi:MAG: putative signal transducing protein [Actinomycetota bacterium]